MKAIVTGHTRGLGAAITENLLERGYAVLAIARRSNTDLGERHAQLTQVEIDLANPAELVNWVQGDALRLFLDGANTCLLINNAGVVDPFGALSEQDPAAVARSVSVNVSAPMVLSAAFAAAAPAAADKRIVQVSSGAARNAYPGWSIYCGTKASLDNHARSVQRDNNANIRICSLAPGVIDTGMQGQIRDSSKDEFPLREKFERLKNEGVLVTPARCAEQMVSYALSDAFGTLAVADLRDL